MSNLYYVKHYTNNCILITDYFTKSEQVLTTITLLELLNKYYNPVESREILNELCSVTNNLHLLDLEKLKVYKPKSKQLSKLDPVKDEFDLIISFPNSECIENYKNKRDEDKKHIKN